MSKVHTLEFRRTSQDEGQLVCASCDYVRAVPLTLATSKIAAKSSIVAM
ncbi:MAG: hypothetical protein KDK05_00430 [Candidatus Competibacteraceae bacterium]|nr:hypothetical protein [Candidatus Competibacteraceae bacterium]